MNWISTIISNNTNFARACNHIDINLAEYLALRCGYVNITRAYDFIYLWNGFRTVSQRRYPLGTAHLVHRINTSQFCRTKYSRVNAILLRRCHHNDFFYPCDFGWQCSHDNSRWIRRCTARNVETNTSQGNHLLTADDTRCIHVHKALLNFSAMELRNIRLCL